MAIAPIIWADSFMSRDETPYVVAGTLSASGGRGSPARGSCAPKLQWSAGVSHKLWIVSFALKLTTGGGVNESCPLFNTGLKLHFDPTTKQLIPSTGGSTAKSVLANVYIHVAVRVYFDGSAGTLDVWFDETNVLSQTAKNTGSAATSVTFDLSAGNSFLISDLVIQASDTASDEPIGDRAVTLLSPTSDGTHSGFTPSAGSDHYALVDEAPPDGDTSYNSADTAGDKDSYGLTDLASSVAAIDALVWKASAKKTDAGTRSVKPLFVIDSTDYAGDAQNLGTSYAQYYQVYEQSPATDAAWTVSEVNALDAGVEVGS